jgi:hypothetical protein
MKRALVGVGAVLLVACNKSAGDAPPSSTSAVATASVPATAIASASAASAPPLASAAPAASARASAAACPLAQEIATSWCARRLEGCKESAMTAEQCKDAFVKYTAIGACKGSDADKRACLTAVAALPCEKFKVTGSSVPAACTTALQ